MTNPPPLTVEQICRRLNVPAPAGISQRNINGISTLEDAREDQVAYVSKEKFAPLARDSRAGLILVPSRIELKHPAVLSLEDVMAGVLELLAYFHPDPAPSEEHHVSAIIAESARIGKNVFLGANTVIGENVQIGDNTRIEAATTIGGNCVIGQDCWLSPNVTVLHGSRIGNRVRLHPGVVIGADGFRFELINGRLQKIPQVGYVVIEDDVEIGANSTIDRASLTETRIGARTKIDNLVQVGHNVQIGSDCIVVAQSGIAGSTRIGRGVMIAGGVSIKDNLVIGDGVRIGGRAGVQNNLPPGAEVLGVPAIPVKDYARFVAFYRRFTEHWQKLRPMLSESDREEKDEKRKPQ